MSTAGYTKVLRSAGDSRFPSFQQGFNRRFSAPQIAAVYLCQTAEGTAVALDDALASYGGGGVKIKCQRVQVPTAWRCRPGGAGNLECRGLLTYSEKMTIKRLDHISVVVDDLPAAIAFFTELGISLEGKGTVEGPWVDRINGLENVQVDIVMMRTPDGHGRLELTKFRNPKLVEIEPAIAPPNALGLRSVMFAVESLDDTVARMLAHGAELVGEIAQYKNLYRLCYMRGPGGIIVSLAEELFS